MSQKVGMFSALMTHGKIELIDSLKIEIAASSASSKSEFSDLLKVVFGKQVGLDKRVLSDDLGHTYGSVCRWVTAQTVPHQALWPKIVSWIERSLDKKRGELQALLVS
jgi:hypothetical protein